MALLGFEGFDPYGTAAQAGQYLNQAVVGSLGLNTANPRTGRACLSFGSGAQAFRMSFARSGTTIIAGVAVNWTGSFANGVYPLRFWASTQARSSIVLSLNSSGNLILARGLGTENAGGGLGGLGTTLWTGAEIEPQNTWVYYELKVQLAATATGAVTLRRNNQVVVALSAVQTLVNAADDVNSIIIDRSSTGFAYLADDLYVADGSGTGNNDFLGDVRVRTLLPTSEAAVAWSPSSAGTNLAKVQDTTPDDDTGYVSTVTVGAQDRFGLASVAERDRQMRLADAARPEKDHVLGALDEGQAGQFGDLLARRAGGEAEIVAVQRLDGREPSVRANTITVHMYQLSEAVGRGTPRTATIRR